MRDRLRYIFLKLVVLALFPKKRCKLTMNPCSDVPTEFRRLAIFKRFGPITDNLHDLIYKAPMMMLASSTFLHNFSIQFDHIFNYPKRRSRKHVETMFSEKNPKKSSDYGIAAPQTPHKCLSFLGGARGAVLASVPGLCLLCLPRAPTNENLPCC